MRRSIKSTYSISKKLQFDIWFKIFRFNKNVRIQKWLSINQYYVRRERYPIRLKNFHKLRLRIKDYTKIKKEHKVYFIIKLNELKKFKVFYGLSSNRKYRSIFFNIKGKVSYFQLNFFFNKVEFRPYILLFRVGQFSDTIVPLQIAKNNFVYKNNFKIKYQEVCKVGDIVNIPVYFFNKYELMRKMKKPIISSRRQRQQKIVNKLFSKFYNFNFFIISEFLPIFVIYKNFNVFETKTFIKKNVNFFLFQDYF